MLKEFMNQYFGETNKYTVLESTYGDIVRSNKEKVFDKKINKLKSIIEDTVNKGGNVLIAIFALNRLQEILIDLSVVAKTIKLNRFHKKYFQNKSYTLEKLLSNNKKRVIPLGLTIKLFQNLKNYLIINLLMRLMIKRKIELFHCSMRKL